MRLLIGASIGAIFLMNACAGKDCYDNQNSLPLAAFYTSSSKPKECSANYLTIYGINAPSKYPLIDSVASISQVYLPFDIDVDYTRYVFQWHALDGRDTVEFRYLRQPYFVSSECGAIYKYKIQEIITTHFAIDSVTCPQGIITNANKVNLYIYLKQDSEE